MDLKLSLYDLDITNGDLSFVVDDEAARQDIEMALRTWLGETPYDKSAGVPYLQIIFQPGTTIAAIRFIVEQQILARPGVSEVLELTTEVDRATRELTITAQVRLGSGSVVQVTA